MADLDLFKSINDTCGHLVGDAVLREAARRLKTAARRYDSVGRYGGEEFLIVLPDCDTECSVVVAERARASVAAPLQVANLDWPLSVSLGVASTRGAPEDPDGLIHAADAALYRAKAAGRNCVAA